jgi:hypothetical protein
LQSRNTSNQPKRKHQHHHGLNQNSGRPRGNPTHQPPFHPPPFPHPTNTHPPSQGSGNLGPALINELLAAGFSVTAITRSASTSPTPKFPDGLPVKKVDYTSFDELKAAFANQDAVVSTVGSLAVPRQKTAIDAAVAAGVKRFIPSEFGINTRKVRGTPIGVVLAGKIDVVDYLEEVVAKGGEGGGFSWTGLSTGLFFDWVCVLFWFVLFCLDLT